MTDGNRLGDEGIHALLGADVDLDGRGLAAGGGDLAGDGGDGRGGGFGVWRFGRELGRVCDGFRGDDDCVWKAVSWEQAPNFMMKGIYVRDGVCKRGWVVKCLGTACLRSRFWRGRWRLGGRCRGRLLRRGRRAFGRALCVVRVCYVMFVMVLMVVRMMTRMYGVDGR